MFFSRDMLVSGGVGGGFNDFNLHPDPCGDDPIWLILSNGLQPTTGWWKSPQQKKRPTLRILTPMKTPDPTNDSGALKTSGNLTP